jgi:hypothetical protein
VHELHTEIEIAATRERVWSILTDFGAYPRWNPFIRSIDGAPEKGASRLLIPGIFDGEHRFVIEPLPNGQVRFQQSERYSGVLVPLFRGSLDRDTKRGFPEMNVALKRQAEWCRT